MWVTGTVNYIMTICDLKDLIQGETVHVNQGREKPPRERVRTVGRRKYQKQSNTSKTTTLSNRNTESGNFQHGEIRFQRKS